MNTMNMNEQQNSTEQFSPQTGTKTSSKKRYLILLLIIALIICAGAGIAFASFFFSPKAVLARAAKNTFSENNFPGFRSAMTAVQSGKYETAYSMTLNKLQIDTDMANSKLFADTGRTFINQLAAYLEGIGIEGTTRMDVPAKQLSSDMTLSYLSKPYVMFSLYGAQNTLMFSLPELMDGQITMRTDTFGRDYNASVLSEAASVTLPEDYALTLFHETETFPMDMENMTITKLESTDAFEGFDSIPPATQDTDYYACTWDNSRTEVICMVNDTPLITAAVIRNIDLQDVSPDTSESPVAETDSATDYAPESMDILFSKYGNNLETYAKLYDADKTVLYTAAMSGKFSGGSDFMNETQSLCYNFDSLILTDSVNGISLTLYGDVSIQAPQTAIEAPTGKQYDIFHMSMEDIQTLIEGIVDTWVEQNFSFSN